MPPKATILPPREPDENAHIPGRSILDLGRIPARDRRSIAEQQEDNDAASLAHLEPISKEIEDLPRIRVNGKEYVKEGHVHSSRDRRSSIWLHGHGLIEIPSRKKYWACKSCDDKGIITIYLSASTVNALDHLEKAHKIYRRKRARDLIEEYPDNDSLPSTPGSQASSASSDQGTLPGMFERATKKLKKVLYPEELVEAFKDRFIRWLVAYQIPLVAVENDLFYRILQLCDPKIAALLPYSGDTVRAWIMDAYEARKSQLKREIHQNAVSMIHLSFDLWTSPNCIPLMGVVAHYTDKSYRNRTTMIALKRLRESHSGENQGSLLIEIIKDFDLKERLGYFITDNAGSNDTAVEFLLTTLLPTLTETKRTQRRLRCFGHILNLACGAYLYGHDPESFEVEVIVLEALAREQEELKAWRKHGPIGKLHNIVVFIRRSPQRREAFLRLAVTGEEYAKLMLIQDNSTRWNSVYSMIDRAMKKQSDVQIFVIQSGMEKERYKRIDVEDHLTAEDWRVLTEVLNHLKPFYEMTLRLQSRAKEGHHGSLWEGLPAMEYLLDKVITAKKDHARRTEDDLPWNDDPTAQTNKHIAASLDNCWGKLDEYYKMLDDTPVYAAAIVLHPGQGWRYLEEMWTTDKQKQWLESAKTAVKTLWNDDYKTNIDLNVQGTVQAPSHPPSSSSSSPDDLDSFMNPTGFYNTTTTRDEYAEYCRLVIAPCKRPLEWWGARRQEYPRLSKMAFDLLSIPLMSAECERIFSVTKRFIPSDRNRLKDDIIEAMSSLRHWYKADTALEAERQ
jgi:hAT family C-terminal dimerisation region